MTLGGGMAVVPGRRRFRVTAVHIAGTWRWKDVPRDCHCVICDNILEMTCGHCASDPGDECPPAIGTCGHCFHLHCIGRWLTREGVQNDEQGTCPMCRRPWRFASTTARHLLQRQRKISQADGSLEIDMVGGGEGQGSIDGDVGIRSGVEDGGSSGGIEGVEPMSVASPASSSALPVSEASSVPAQEPIAPVAGSPAWSSFTYL